MMITAQHALILGAGSSGLAAARLLCQAGSQVILADQRSPDLLRAEREQIESWGGQTHFGEPRLPWGPFELCVVSPGFPFESDWVQAAYALSAHVVSELELGWSCLSAKCLAITGSNGKSTAVKWAAEAIQAAGLRCVAAGNYGRPVCDVCMEDPDIDWIVLEVSSFQFETVNRFAPDIGLVLNLHPNHLDRHGSMARYADLKARMFSQMTTSSLAICPYEEIEDWRTRTIRKRREWGQARMVRDTETGEGPRWIGFSTEDEASDYRCREGVVYRGTDQIIDFGGTRFSDPALAVTAAAVTAAFDQGGLSLEPLLTAAASFSPLPHRLTVVCEKQGVLYVNDSKSTNSGSLAHALRCFEQPIRLIAGGLAKEPNFENLKQLLTNRVKTVYLIGKAAEQMLADWSDCVDCVHCGTLEAAVRQARVDGVAGDVVLFSPGCASFDQYRSYEERGEHFTRLLE